MREEKSKRPRSTSSRRSALQKSSKPTSTQPAAIKVSSWNYKRASWFALGSILLVALLSYILYLRFPDSFTQPNFYAEDGSVFAKNIILHGFLHSMGTTFNGYYIWGIYILEKIGFIINGIFYGGQFVNLPRSLAIVSYGFLGLLAALPILLFRNIFKMPALIIASLLILFVPLAGWDYAVIGTIGNAKFEFIFLAFLMLVYRHYLPENSKKVYIVDVVLLICAYTNITVYPMLLFALVRYWPKLDRKNLWSSLRNIVLYDRTAQSLIGLGILMLPQLYIIKRYGVPKMPGYLDTPYNYHRTIEIFVGRSYVYTILFTVWKFMTDLFVMIVFLFILVLFWLFNRKNLTIVVFGLASIFLATLLFVIKRTGVSALFIGYKDPGPAQFFFVQNWIFAFLIGLLVAALVRKFKNSFYRFCTYLVVIIVILTVLAPASGTFGKNNFEQETVGNIYANAQKTCESKKQILSVTIYPTPNEVYGGLSRNQLCTAAAVDYQPQEVSLGLQPYNNDVLYNLGITNHFTQTFVSPNNNLNGLDVYFSTFLRTVHSPYTLTVYDDTCKTTLRTVNIHTSKISDNSYFLISFPPIASSKNKTYCFSIASNNSNHADLLAVQLSKSDVYKDGLATINNKPSNQDVVFELHYK